MIASQTTRLDLVGITADAIKLALIFGEATLRFRMLDGKLSVELDAEPPPTDAAESERPK